MRGASSHCGLSFGLSLDATAITKYHRSVAESHRVPFGGGRRLDMAVAGGWSAGVTTTAGVADVDGPTPDNGVGSISFSFRFRRFFGGGSIGAEESTGGVGA